VEQVMLPADQMIHRELSEQIIGAAMTVLNTLEPGLSEKIYENALVVELTERGLKVDQQHEYRVEFRGKDVGSLIPDLIVENKVIVDTKVVEGFDDNHIATMLSYLAISKLQLVLLINFKFTQLRWKRIVRTFEPKGIENNETGDRG
jgi:GxxExxY protein